MQDNQEKLYEAFGELLYVIAMADGFIQDEEITALEEVLADHPWASDIKWSFNYERKKGTSVDQVYAKVLDYCKFRGPHPEYQKMIEVMKAVATASAGIDADEKAVMDGFVNTLTNKFQNDINNLQ
jgi:tellurite resistance protein